MGITLFLCNKKRNEKGIMAYLCCYGLFVFYHFHVHVSKLRILSPKKKMSYNVYYRANFRSSKRLN